MGSIHFKSLAFIYLYIKIKNMSESIVSLQGVNIYQGKSLILQDVNFNVEKGEFVYLVGKTGTGKSSLLKTLYGELTLTEGTASVVGYDLRNMDWKKVPFLRRNLGTNFKFSCTFLSVNS